MTAKRIAKPDRETAANLLQEVWREVNDEYEAHPACGFIADETLKERVKHSVNNAQVGVRYCLPVQLLGKLTDESLDAQSLQAVEAPGSWDARSFAGSVIAPFFNPLNNVLGSAADPYVSNPYRIPRIERDQAGIKDVESRNEVVDVLEAVQTADDPEFTRKVLKQVCLEILKRLRETTFTFPIPSRISLNTCLGLCQQFLAEKSGGDRGLAVAAALFKTLGRHFKLFEDVRRGVINASDAATGMAGDIECIDADANIKMVVEVKERRLTLSDVEGAILKARNANLSEIFLTAPGVAKVDQQKVTQKVHSASSGGQNVYIFDIYDLAATVLALGGEKIRLDFIKHIGFQLDLFNTQPRHRTAWKKLLEAV